MGAAQLAIAITTLALQYGVPLAIDLAKTWKDGLGDKEPTEADWETLRGMVPDANSYFTT